MPFPISGGSIPSINQTAHGFVVGDWVYLNGTVYTKVDADLDASSDSVGVVTSIVDVNNFRIATEGIVTGLTGLVAGTRYYISTTAGAITPTAPASNIKAVFIADSTTSGYVQQYAVGSSSLVAEYGENNGITNGFNIPNAVIIDIGGSSFSLPSAGVWDVEYRAFYLNTTNNVGPTLFITDSSNNVVAGSYASQNAANAGTNTSVTGMVSNRVTITTTGASTYKIRGNSSNGSVNIQNASGSNSGAGNSKITWRKISGSIPSSGQTVDYIEVGQSVNQTTLTGTSDIIWSSVKSGNIPLNTTTGVFTLTAGKTYDMTAVVRILAGAAGNYLAFEWVDAVSNTALVGGNMGQALPMSFTLNDSPQPTAHIIYTPSSNQTVKVRANAGNSNGTITNTVAALSYASIKQLGSSAVIAGVYPGTWTTYTPTITATAAGTNPTLPTSASITGSYTVQGKVMLLNIRYSALSVTGGTAGTQSYSFNLPAGFVIDNTKAILPTDVTNTALSGFDGSTVGTAFMRNSTNSGAGTVVAVTTTGVGVFSDNNARLIGVGSFALNGASNTSFSLVCQIPIL